MHRPIFLVSALLVAIWPGLPALGRVMELGDAAAFGQAAPAVVSISTWKIRPADRPGDFPERVKFYGSGFIVSPTGIIVTNRHVIDGAIQMRVLFNDGSQISARLLAASPLTDVALLKVDVDHPLPTLDWGNSDSLQVGDPVLTIGNDLDWGASVSAGIISGLNRNLQDTPFDNYIQTDATINHGDSGGPMIDRNGHVVGIDTALYNPDQNGGFIGIGFAIPASLAQFAIRRLLDPKYPVPGWLGFNLQDMTNELATAFGVQQHKGAIISTVEPSGPAGQASLLPGDVLEAYNGQRLTDSRAFMREIARSTVGTPAHLTISRLGAEREITVTVAAWPNFVPDTGVITGMAAAAMMSSTPDPCMKFAALTDGGRKRYGLSPKVSGVLITHVERESEAHDMGIQAGDVITSAQGRPVTTPDEVLEAIKTAHEFRRPFLALLIQSKTGARWFPLSIGDASSS
jgi:serine protease Do